MGFIDSRKRGVGLSLHTNTITWSVHCLGFSIEQCSALSAAYESLGSCLFCHNTVVLCLCWQIQGQLRCKRVQKAQPLSQFLLTFERGTWIVHSLYFIFRTRQKAQNGRSHLLALCSFLWRSAALCVAVVESNISILLENLLFSSVGCLKQLSWCGI